MDYESSEVNNFMSNFRLRFQTDPNQYAFVGYDAANLMLRIIARAENPEFFKTALRNLTIYRGLASNIRFSGKHINQSIFIKKNTQD